MSDVKCSLSLSNFSEKLDELNKINDEYNIKLENLKKYLKKIEKIKIYLKEDNIEFIRVIPPYIEKCSVDNPKCIKAGSFLKKSDNTYYCWFHVNCN